MFRRYVCVCVCVCINGILLCTLFCNFFLASLQQLAGSQFPDQGLNPGHGSESLES